MASDDVLKRIEDALSRMASMGDTITQQVRSGLHHDIEQSVGTQLAAAMAPIEQRMAAVEGRVASISVSSGSTTASSDGSGPTHGPAHKRPRGPDGSAGSAQHRAPSPVAADATNTRLVWVTGFDREVLASQLRIFYDTQVKPLLTHAQQLSAQVKFGGLARAFSIELGTAAEAADFMVSANARELHWQDPRGPARSVRFKPDRSLPTRKRQRALGVLWQKTLPYLQQSAEWNGSYKLATHGSRGLLYARSDSDHHELFRMEMDPNHQCVNIVPVDEGTLKFHLSVADISTIVDGTLAALRGS